MNRLMDLFDEWEAEEDHEYLQMLVAYAEALEEEEEEARARQTRRYIRRDRVGANNRLMADYFEENATYPAEYFRRRFRMSKELFLRIVDDITSYGIEPIPLYFDYFRQRSDARGHIGFSAIQKCTSAIRQLAYGTTPDANDEYLQMGETTSRYCLDAFCKCIFTLYAEEYLRKPTPQDIQRLYTKHEEIHGFPGMLGSIDCMHWPWRNCPTAWSGQYTRGDQGEPTIMLEAVASYDLWIWHAYFGAAGANNDINVLNQSDLFNDIIEDAAPDSSFIVNGHQYKKGYYLADGIYPDWSVFVKSFTTPQDDQRRKFKQYQESARKDVERAFGVLQGRWAIIKQPARSFSVNKIRRIMYTCVILHNMIVEDSENAITSLEENYIDDSRNVPERTFTERIAVHQRTRRELRDRHVHNALRRDLVEHIWNLP